MTIDEGWDGDEFVIKSFQQLFFFVLFLFFFRFSLNFYFCSALLCHKKPFGFHLLPFFGLEFFNKNIHVDSNIVSVTFARRAIFPKSIHRSDAKLVDSAQLNPWLNPAWYEYGKVIINSPAL